MREIKFRVWNNDYKKFHYYDYDEGFDNYKFWDLINDFNHERPQQYTGSKDDSGKEIYEGDIIKLGSYLYEIVWYGYQWCCDDHFKTGQSSNLQGMNKYMIQGCEVIGNIFETPELLNINN